MFEKKIYKCECHVCGVRFDHESEFFSSGCSEVCEDGIERAVVTCNVNHPYHQHMQQEIYASYHNG